MKETSTRQTGTIVIGAGQAGLAISRLLAKRKSPHVVFERGRVGNSWRTQRWDSFRLNTPNRINVLPDGESTGDDGAFCSASELVETFERYRVRFDLPVIEQVTVTRVRAIDGGFDVDTSEGSWTCRNVVICSGDQNLPQTPAQSASIPDDLTQLHAAAYRSPDQLPEGAVLVVGSGQSGVQIAEDLLEAQRRVTVCSSFVGRVPRRYRGRDISEWIELAGLANQRPQDLADPNEVYARQAQTSGTRGGHSVSLHLLARQGATVVGRLEAVEGRALRIGDQLLTNVARGDKGAEQLKKALDGLIAKAGIDAPPPEEDPADAPFEGMAELASIRAIDLDEAGIRTVIWATGFGGSFGYLDASLLDERGRPRHRDGICPVPGLYCLGFTWLRRRISGLIAGIPDDAACLVDEIV